MEVDGGMDEIGDGEGDGEETVRDSRVPSTTIHNDNTNNPWYMR